ncbi:MAG: hypothetical protein KAR80_03085 [Rhodospirillaceae bacterium]|nr:hypothetical protein [Rhodospirillaceae bacterium]
MNNPTAAQISQQLEKVESLITTSKRLLEEGKMVDLSALEERIRELTDNLKKCDPETAKPFLEAVHKLIDSLEGIEQNLEDHQQELLKGKEELERKKARNAYQNDEK